MLIGNDGGLAVSWDQAKTWNFFPNLPVGLFYHVSVDMATPYNICGGMQDNYSWCGPSAVRGAAGIASYRLDDDAGRRRVRRASGSDRLPHRLQRVAGRQHGAHRSRHRRNDVDPAEPQPGEPALRWNWDTPLVMSPHDPKIIYAAGNKVFRSVQPRPHLGKRRRRSDRQ